MNINAPNRWPSRSSLSDDARLRMDQYDHDIWRSARAQIKRRAWKRRAVLVGAVFVLVIGISILKGLI